MPVYDYECQCGATTEAICGINTTEIKCRCGKTAKRIISMSGVHCGNTDDTTWARAAVEVMDKDSHNPIVRQFIKDPTKANLKKAMKAEGIRHMEPGERPITRTPFDLNRHTEKVMERHMEKGRIEVRG